MEPEAGGRQRNTCMGPPQSYAGQAVHSCALVGGVVVIVTAKITVCFPYLEDADIKVIRPHKQLLTRYRVKKESVKRSADHRKER